MSEADRARVQAVLELRRSSAASPVPSGKAYRRKEKHSKRLYNHDEG